MSSLAAAHGAATTLLALDDNKVTPGILGFVVFAVLGIGTWWILKAMNRSLGRVDFVEEPEPQPKAAPKPTVEP
ncbi:MULTISPECIES: hypothetical protein [Streptacidiphilus]|uniref:Uncharacterized protein n=2 Tax=Streptacidiphilus TaxID=228398 RepID=A0ABV6UM46_9ACTN|nr:hypothetical protein [Streptacidiphilus jeojiense]